MKDMVRGLIVICAIAALSAVCVGLAIAKLLDSVRLP